MPLVWVAQQVNTTEHGTNPSSIAVTNSQRSPLISIGSVTQLWQAQVMDNEAKLTKGTFVYNYMDLLCFLLSGLPADGTIAAEVAFMFQEWFKPGASLEFPKGGSQAMVQALVRHARACHPPPLKFEPRASMRTPDLGSI